MNNPWVFIFQSYHWDADTPGRSSIKVQSGSCMSTCVIVMHSVKEHLGPKVILIVGNTVLLLVYYKCCCSTFQSIPFSPWILLILIYHFIWWILMHNILYMVLIPPTPQKTCTNHHFILPHFFIVSLLTSISSSFCTA